MGVHHNKFWEYDKAEANICLTCKKKKCTGRCDRLRQEKRKLKNNNKKDVK